MAVSHSAPLPVASTGLRRDNSGRQEGWRREKRLPVLLVSFPSVSRSCELQGVEAPSRCSRWIQYAIFPKSAEPASWCLLRDTPARQHSLSEVSLLVSQATSKLLNFNFSTVLLSLTALSPCPAATNSAYSFCPFCSYLPS